MDKEKQELRDALFAKYFEEDGERVELPKLLEQVAPLTEVWQQLHKLLEKNIEYFEFYSDIEMVKILPYQGNMYLFIKESVQSYIIIDLKTKEVLDREQIAILFNDDFFVENFNEEEPKTKNNLYLYDFFTCDKNVEEIINFCLAHQDTLTIPNRIYFEFFINEACTYLSIHLANNDIQIGFQTPDQYLYEYLLLNLDLTPCPMQDAHERIGKEKMQEMFSKVKDIKFPKEIIPKEWLEEEYVRRNKKF